MPIIIIDKPIAQKNLEALALERWGDMVKAVVDVEKHVMALGGELHADEEQALLENGSRQERLWGINIYPQKDRKEWIEFDSMINIRPSQDNRSRGIESEEMRQRIMQIIDALVVR